MFSILFFLFFRAQNDANLRKEKCNSLKRANKPNRAKDENGNGSTSQVNSPIPPPSPAFEKQSITDKLLKEIEILKETNKNLAEKAQVCWIFYSFNKQQQKKHCLKPIELIPKI